MDNRYAARIVLLDQKDRVACIKAEKFGRHDIPGGGVNEGEDSATAAKREVREETGCECMIVGKLGQIITELPSMRMLDISDGFVGHVLGEKQPPRFEAEELEAGYSLEWWDNLDELIAEIEGTQINDPDASAIQARDLEFLKRARKYLKDTSAGSNVLTLREASDQLNIGIQALRRICNLGLIPRVRRNKLKHRVLEPWQVDFAYTLLNMKRAGFSPKEIRRYARLFRQGERTAEQRLAILTTRKHQLWHEIKDRQAAIDFIERQEEIFQDTHSAE